MLSLTRRCSTKVVLLNTNLTQGFIVQNGIIRFYGNSLFCRKPFINSKHGFLQRAEPTLHKFAAELSTKSNKKNNRYWLISGGVVITLAFGVITYNAGTESVMIIVDKIVDITKGK